MELKWILFVALLAVAAARPGGRYGDDSDEEERSYEFKYQVEDESDELDFGHKEQKSDGRVEGYYYVLLPDTRVQKVSYYVEGDSGYVADVAYSGEAKFDSKESKEYGR